MAAGDITLFDQFLLDLGKKIHNLSSDTFNLGVITDAVTPAVGTSDPRWGAGGGTNLSSNQVGTSGTAYTGPKTLASISWTLVSGKPTFRAANVTIDADAAGFTNGRWGIIYNNTAAGKQAVGFIDLGAATSIASASFTFDWNGANGDIFTLDQA